MSKLTHTKRIKTHKNEVNDGKALYKLMKQAVYGKTMENLRNRIHVKLVNYKQYYLKWTSKPSYMSHKTFDNDLVTIRKSKATLKLKQSGICWHSLPS